MSYRCGGIIYNINTCLWFLWKNQNVNGLIYQHQIMHSTHGCLLLLQCYLPYLLILSVLSTFNKTLSSHMTPTPHYVCTVIKGQLIRGYCPRCEEYVQAPVPLMILLSNLKLDQNLKCSGLKFTQLITMEFCTWRVQNFIVIGWAYFKLQHSKFLLIFKFDRNTVCGMGASTRRIK